MLKVLLGLLKSKDLLKKVTEDNYGCKYKLYVKNNTHYGCYLAFESTKEACNYVWEREENDDV